MLDLQFAGGVLFDVASKGAIRRGTVEFAIPTPVFAFACHDGGRSFAAGGETGVVRWWSEGGAVFEDFAQPGKVAALAIHPDGEQLFVSTYDGESALLRKDGTRVPLASSASLVHGVALTPDGMTVAVRGKAWTLHPLDGRPARPLPAAHAVNSGRSGGELLVQYVNRATLLDTRTGRELVTVPTSRFHRGAALIGPRDTLFVEGQIIDYTGAKALELPKPVFHHWSTVALAADGRWLMGGAAGLEGGHGELMLVDATGKAARLVDSKPVYSVAFSPDGRRIYYSCGTGPSLGAGPTNPRLRVRDAETLELEHDVPVGISRWRFLDADRALVMTRGFLEGDKLQVWDVATLRPIQTLRENCGGDCLLANDGRTLVLHDLKQVEVYRLKFD